MSAGGEPRGAFLQLPSSTASLCRKMGTRGGSPVSLVGLLPARSSPSTQLDGELSAVLTGVGPAEPAREAQVCSEMTMQHLRPGDVDGDAHLSREALALYGDGHGPWVLRGDKGQFPWK